MRCLCQVWHDLQSFTNCLLYKAGWSQIDKLFLLLFDHWGCFNCRWVKLHALLYFGAAESVWIWSWSMNLCWNVGLFRLLLQGCMRGVFKWHYMERRSSIHAPSYVYHWDSREPLSPEAFFKRLPPIMVSVLLVHRSTEFKSEGCSCQIWIKSVSKPWFL